MRKFLLILLFIPLISFGQNFPFEISKDFVKLNDKEKYDFLLEEYIGYKVIGFSFAEEYHKIKGNYEIYKRFNKFNNKSNCFNNYYLWN